jgi:tetratricopeptide (TPR) repeat protein
LVSDAPEAEVRRLFEETLRFVSTAKVLLGRRETEISPVRIILFDSDEEYRRFAPDLIAGYTMPSINGTEVVLSLELDQLSLPVLYHELVHVILFQHDSLVYPLWYHEGLAEFMSSALVRGDVATVGAAPEIREITIRESEPLRLSDILSRRSILELSDEEMAQFYADAWAFVYFLHAANGSDRKVYFDGMNRYLMALGNGEEWRSAIEPSFGVSLEGLESEYRLYRKKLTSDDALSVKHLRVPDREYAYTVTPLSEADAMTRLGEHAVAMGEERVDVAEEFFEAAIDLEPENLRAAIGMSSVWSMRGEPVIAEEILSSLPSDGEHSALVFEARGLTAVRLAELMTPMDQELYGFGYIESARADFTRAVERNPESASAWFYLGSTYVMDPSSSAEVGIDALLKAGELCPGSLDVRLGLGALYARSGQVQTAQRHLRHVLASHDETRVQRAQRIIDSEGLDDF